ncbi:MAG: DUF4340 domain-containing protein [Planctomycetota bacterium]
MSRFNLILIGLALTQGIVLAVLCFSGSDTPESNKREPQALLKVAQDEVAAIRISSRDGQNEKEIGLTKSDAGWTVDGSDGFLAKADKIDEFLGKLIAVEVARPIIKNESNHEPAKVADALYERKIELADAAGKTLSSLFVARGSRGRAVYVRNSGEAEVYETEDLQLWDLSPDMADWISSELFKIEADQISELRLRPAGASKDWVFVRFKTKSPDEPKTEGDDAATAKDDAESTYIWKMASPKTGDAKKDKIDGLLKKLCGLRAEFVYGKKTAATQGLDQPTTSAKLKLEGGQEITILIGAKDQKNRRPVLSSQSEYLFAASDWTLSDIVDVKLPDLLEEQEDEAKEEVVDPPQEKN